MTDPEAGFGAKHRTAFLKEKQGFFKKTIILLFSIDITI